MAVRLDKTDVVVIGLGGAGGVAVEPLTAAGLDVDRARSGHVARAEGLRAR